MLVWVFIGIILNYLGLFNGWTIFWFIVCLFIDIILKNDVYERIKELKEEKKK